MSIESGGNQSDTPEKQGRVKPYIYRDRERGETYASPFVVTVSGIGGEFFGAGIVVGQIDGNPAIEVRDCNDQRPYIVMGYETWWTIGVVEEVLGKVQTGELPVDSVAQYRRLLDERSRTIRAEDAVFLSQNGIDPTLE